MTEPSNIVFLSAGNGTVVDANIVLSHLPGNNNNNVDEVDDQKEKMKDNPASALALSKFLSCDACKSETA